MNLHTKVRTNVTIDPQLLAEAKAHKLILSSLLEEAIRERLKDEAARQWRTENREAIEAYNRAVILDGLFSEGIRSF